VFNLVTQYGKSLVAGGLAGLVHVIGLFILHEFISMHYLVASVVSYAGAIFFNFVLQKYFVYQNYHEKKYETQFVRYAILSLGSLILNTVSMHMLVGQWGWYYLIAQVVIIVCLSTVNYLVGRNFIFR
jgi:putative flippase GtrA